jgi:hypothetical protein
MFAFRRLDVQPGGRAEVRVVPDVAVDHDHVLFGDVRVLRLSPLVAFLARDRLVLPVGLVRDDEGRALRARNDSVCTFRFPYAVGVAFGILAASALASAGEGFSITLGRVRQPEQHLRHESGCYLARHESIRTSAGAGLIR